MKRKYTDQSCDECQGVGRVTIAYDKTAPDYWREFEQDCDACDGTGRERVCLSDDCGEVQSIEQTRCTHCGERFEGDGCAAG